jgi:hypothetical protein
MSNKVNQPEPAPTVANEDVEQEQSADGDSDNDAEAAEVPSSMADVVPGVVDPSDSDSDDAS